MLQRGMVKSDSVQIIRFQAKNGISNTKWINHILKMQSPHLKVAQPDIRHHSLTTSICTRQKAATW